MPRKPTTIGREQLRHAKLVIAFLDSSAPGFITNPAIAVLMQAADLKDIEIWHGKDDAELNPAAVADLFTVLGPMFSLPVDEAEAEAESEPVAHYVEFAAHVASVITHPDTPKTLRNGLQGIAVNIISNETGYEWCSDRAGLTFMLARCLNEADEDYARGSIHAINELLHAGLPESLRDKLHA